MSGTIERSLVEAANWIFKVTALLSLQPVPSERQRRAGLEAETSLHFEGPFRGTLHMRTYGGLLPTISANMLGQAEPPEEKLQLSALAETANMVCGGLLPLLAYEWVFSQTSPRVIAGARLPVPPDPPVAAVELGLGEGRVELVLYMEETATRAA